MSSENLDTFNKTLYLFRQLMIRSHHKFFKKIAPENLNPQHITILYFLHDCGKLKMREIAERTGLSNSAVTYLIDQLASEEYIRRTPCDDDRRVIYIELTEKGTAFVKKSENRHFNFFRKTFDNMNDNEQKTVITFYRSLIDNINEELENDES